LTAAGGGTIARPSTRPDPSPSKAAAPAKVPGDDPAPADRVAAPTSRAVETARAVAAIPAASAAEGAGATLVPVPGPPSDGRAPAVRAAPPVLVAPGPVPAVANVDRGSSPAVPSPSGAGNSEAPIPVLARASVVASPAVSATTASVPAARGDQPMVASVPTLPASPPAGSDQVAVASGQAVPMPPPATSEIEALFATFVETYERGRIDAFAALFDNDADANLRHGRAAIRGEYDELFRQSQWRRMQLTRVNWKRVGDRAVAKGEITIRIGWRDGREVEQRIAVDMELVRRDGRVVIARLSQQPKL